MKTRRSAAVRIAASAMIAAAVTLGAQAFVPTAFGCGTQAGNGSCRTVQTPLVYLNFRQIVSVLDALIP